MKQKDELTENAPALPNDGSSHVEKSANAVSEHWTSLKRSFNKTFEKLTGIKTNDVSSFEKFTRFLYRPTDPASLGIARALFGLCMVIDVVEERGFADIDLKWGDPWSCHFPLIHGMKPPSLPWMIIIYTVMWMGAFGIALGFYFRLACACFALPYCGLDVSNTKQNDNSVPYWNYFILKFQFFALYFLAGLKKSGREWLEGYSMTNLSRHWVFHPFKIFLTSAQTDLLIVHWCAFVFDLSVGFWMLFEKTRIPAMIFCTAFHFMNSRLFRIGMFPYVCLVTMPLFCRTDWPRRLGHYFSWKRKIMPINVDTNNREECETDSQMKDSLNNSKNVETTHEEKEISEKKDENSVVRTESEETTEEDNNTQLFQDVTESIEKETTSVCEETRRDQQSKSSKVTKKQKFVVSLLLCHVGLQFFLPYSHFISQGYNNWVPGLYGYSWDMMVHAWDTVLVVIKVHDNANNEIQYLDPEVWVQGDRWVKHGDMAIQYAQCLKDNLMRRKAEVLSTDQWFEDKEKWMKLSTNLSIYMDVWCSLNGRFQQRVYNPHVDMLTVDWHPLKPISFLMPLLKQYSSYRYKMDEIQQHVYTWSNYTDVLFVADFPGMYLENYISNDFTNVSLTVLEGEVTYKEEESLDDAITISKGRSLPVKTGVFHLVNTTSSYPACYMYTYANQTKQQLDKEKKNPAPVIADTLPLLREIDNKITAWTTVFAHIANAFFNLVYDVPMVRRVRVNM